jgi:CheY-like chemotaxis protein
MAEKILIVDDAKEVLDLIQAMLEGQNYEVVTALNGVEGLAKARQDHPAMIIADVLMPEMDGFIFFKELRKDPQTAKIPVLILTARAKMEDSFRAIGVDGFLPKPIDPNKLLAEVAREVSMFIREKDKLEKQKEVPQTVESLSEYREPSHPTQKKLFIPEQGNKRVVIFGYERSVTEEMAKQLEEKKCQVLSTDNDEELVQILDQEVPALLFMEIKTETTVPFVSVLTVANSVLRSKEMVGRDAVNTDVILYKVHQAVSGVTAMGGDVTDMDNILIECQDIGYTKYIGLYSPFTFMMKIKDFLVK